MLSLHLNIQFCTYCIVPLFFMLLLLQKLSGMPHHERINYLISKRWLTIYRRTCYMYRCHTFEQKTSSQEIALPFATFLKFFKVWWSTFCSEWRARLKTLELKVSEGSDWFVTCLLLTGALWIIFHFFLKTFFSWRFAWGRRNRKSTKTSQVSNTNLFFFSLFHSRHVHEYYKRKINQ